MPLAESLNAELGNILPGIQGVIYGVAIIVIMRLSPEGLFWTIRDRWFRAVPAAGRAGACDTAAAPGGAQRDAVAGRRTCRDRSADCARSDGVSFSVEAGEILGIIGPNGAGKTTLFNLLNGVIAADSGTATLAGESLLGRKVHQVCRMGVGRTFQVVRSFPRLSLLDNVVSAAMAPDCRIRWRSLPRRARLRRSGLSRACRRCCRPAHQQAASADGTGARAGRATAAILLLDETLAGLGRDECNDVLDVLQRLRAEGMTIVIIEHTMHAMLRIADHFVVLDHGRVLAAGKPREVVEQDAVIEAYLGKKCLARQHA